MSFRQIVDHAAACEKYEPNKFRFGVCSVCQSGKRGHSEAALRSALLKAVVERDSIVRTHCEDQNCAFPEMNGKRFITLYDSGIIILKDKELNVTSEIDLSFYNLKITYHGRRECKLYNANHMYTINCDKDFCMSWKEVFKQLADQNSSKKSYRGERKYSYLMKIEADKKQLADIKNLDAMDRSPKVSSPRYNIKTTDTKQVQQTYDKVEAELKNERKAVSDIKQENEKLRRKLLDIEKSNMLLEKEKKESLSCLRDQDKKIVELNSSIAKKHELSEKQLMKAGEDIVSCLNITHVDFTSYRIMVDYICQQDNNLPFLHSFLRHQLESLVHKSPLETSSDLSLYKYLTTSIEMPNDSIVKFLSAFLLSLSKQIFFKPSSKRDLSPNVMQLLQSVIEMVPPAQSLCTTKSFQQHSLEIAYLLERMNLEQNLLLNGHIELVNIEDKFCDLLHSFEIETVNKVLIIELSEQIKEACQIKMSNIKLSEKTIPDKNVIKERLESTWESLRVQLQDKEQQKNDLLVVIKELSAKNTELEAVRSTSDDWRNVDNMVNYYTSLSSKLCADCEVKVVDILTMPVTSMVDKLVEDFMSYWRCVNDLFAFLAKKKNINSDIRDTLDMLKKSVQTLETLMTQLQNITQRNIRNPGVRLNLFDGGVILTIK